MPFTTLSLGLTLTIPTNGTKNWGTTVFNTTWTKISNHAHTGSGDGNLITAAAIAPNSIDDSNITNNLAEPAQTFAPTTGTQAIDWDSGRFVIIDLTSATVDVGLTLNNPADGATYEVWTIGGAGGWVVTWPSAARWPSGVNPIHSTGVGEIDVVRLRYSSGNSIYTGSWELDHKI